MDEFAKYREESGNKTCQKLCFLYYDIILYFSITFFPMSKAYISFDIEASGRTPGRYSMLSLGACLVDDTSVRFYKELKPISSEYIEGAMRVGSLGLKCLEPYKEDPTCNPLHADFVPKRVLEILSIE